MRCAFCVRFDQQWFSPPGCIFVVLLFSCMWVKKTLGEECCWFVSVGVDVFRNELASFTSVALLHLKLLLWKCLKTCGCKVDLPVVDCLVMELIGPYLTFKCCHNDLNWRLCWYFHEVIKSTNKAFVKIIISVNVKDRIR